MKSIRRVRLAALAQSISSRNPASKNFFSAVASRSGAACESSEPKPRRTRILVPRDCYPNMKRPLTKSAQFVAALTLGVEEAEIETSKAVRPTKGTKSVSSGTSASKRDEITAPSAASGGTPEPTALYLSSAQGAPTRLASPRRILIVVDLNGTVLFRPHKRRPFHFIARPHARTFMGYLLDNFAVVVWSSARSENVGRMLKCLLTPQQCGQIAAVWGRNKFGLSPDDYELRVQCYKRLTRVWDSLAVAAAHPTFESGGRWDQTNTVLIDDSAEKARSEPHNLICVPSYEGPENESPLVLPQVHDYINELAHQADISRYIRQNAFTLNPDYKL